MATHLDYDLDNRVIYVTTAPTNGVLTLDVQKDIYSSVKSDWRSLPYKRLKFPFFPQGGFAITDVQDLTPYFQLRADWSMRPYEGNHSLYLINGVLVQVGGGDPWINTVGAYNVRINSNVPSDARSVPAEGAAASDIADAVWNEPIADHLTVGSTGEALNNISAGASPAQIAAAVWNEVMSGHLTAGTAGQYLNLLNSLTVDSGAVVAGTLFQHQFTTDLTETTLNHYKTQFVVFTSGANKGASRPIVGYAIDGTITVSPWFSSAPNIGDTFVIMSQTMSADVTYWNGQAVPGGPAGVPAVNVTYVDGVGPAGERIGDFVWNEALSGHTTADTAGGVLNDLKSLVFTKGSVINDHLAGFDQFDSDLTLPDEVVNNGFHATIVFTSGNNAGLVRSVYRKVSGVCHVYPNLGAIPVNGDDFVVVSSSTAADSHIIGGLDAATVIKNSVWSASLGGYSSGAGNILNKMNSLVYHTGSVNDVAANTSNFITDLLADDDNAYEGCILFFTSSGSLRAHARTVVSYDGTTKRIGVFPALDVAPADGDQFSIVTAQDKADVRLWNGNAVFNSINGVPMVDAHYMEGLDFTQNLRSQVWDANIGSHQYVGSTGRAMSDLIRGLAATNGEVTGTSSTAQTIYTDLTEETDSHYDGLLLMFTTGNLAGQARPINGYNGAGKFINVAPNFTEAPNPSSDFVIVTSTQYANVMAMNNSTLLDFKPINQYFDELTTEIGDLTIDGTISLKNTLKVLLSLLGGLSSGGDTATLTFRDRGDTTDVVVMTVDENGNRSSVTINV